MTHVVVLQKPSSTSPIDHWLRDASDCEVTIVTGTDSRRSDPDYAHGTRVVRVPQYDNIPNFEELCAGIGADRVVSNAESDVIRAAHCRDALGLPGMGRDIAIQFRDKVEMKRLFANAQIPSPSFRTVTTRSEVEGAVRELGASVLKPRGGVGATDIHFLDASPDLNQNLSPRTSRLLDAGHLFVETAVVGDMYHVDAVFDRSTLVLFAAARYLNPPHTFRERPLASALIDADSEEQETLFAMTCRLGESVGADSGLCAIHLEFHRDRSGNFSACEVAARTGGGMIKDTIAVSFGVDIVKETYLRMAGFGRTLPALRSAMPAQGPASGHILWTVPNPWRSSSTAEPWMVGCWGDRPSGRRHDASNSADAQGGAVVVGSCHDQVVARLEELMA